MRNYSELQARIVTGFVSALVAVCCLFFLSDEFFYAFICAVFGICAWEWGNLAGLSSFRALLYTVSLAGLVALSVLLKISPVWIISVGLVWWGIALFLVMVYPKFCRFWSAPLTLLIIGIIVLLPSFFAFIGLKSHQNADTLILILLVFIWGADIGAFFIGKAIGGAKLCARVSPGKTWSGVIGGALIVSLLSVLLFQMFDEIRLLGWHFSFFFCLAFFVSIISVIGDLTLSMFKRARGIKDSGSLLPGHGGFLDRVDSLLSASPVFSVVVALSKLYVLPF